MSPIKLKIMVVLINLARYFIKIYCGVYESARNFFQVLFLILFMI